MSRSDAESMSSYPPPPDRRGLREWRVPAVLFLLTIASTLWVGAGMALEREPESALELLAGWSFSAPLLLILVAHELGHYFAARRHRVDVSPPFFIPMPFFLLGTMGAVIRMRARIPTRNALFDIGAAGPLAGLVFAVPLLLVGLAISPIEPLPPNGGYIIEGRSVLYLAALYVTKGSIPSGHDIMLSPTGFAAWAGLLVTMINLVPVGQLDGGHVAYALFGVRQDRFGSWTHRALPLIGVTTSAIYGVAAWQRGLRGDALLQEALAGVHWIMWAIMLVVLLRLSGRKHPPTDDDQLSPKRRALAIFTLVLFVVLFMPSWLRTV